MDSTDPSNVTFPLSSIHIDPIGCEISDHNPEQQDFFTGPSKAPSFVGYFVALFGQTFTFVGVTRNPSASVKEVEGQMDDKGVLLSGYVRSPNETMQVTACRRVLHFCQSIARKYRC